jgi:hypothetical protein
MNPYLPLFLGFLGALLVGVGAWRGGRSEPVGLAATLVGLILLVVVTFFYLLALLGAIDVA